MNPWDKLVPTPQRLVIEFDPVPKEIGRIKVLRDSVERGDAGTIRATGPGTHPDFSVGTRVAFRPFTGHQFRVDNMELLVIHQSEILCVLESLDDRAV